MRKKKKFSFTAVFAPALPGDGYHASVPAISECVVRGDTVDEAREKLHPALVTCLEERLKMDQTIPHDVELKSEYLTEKITVTL